MANVGVQVIGMKTLLGNLAQLGAEGPTAIEAGMYRAASEILGDSQELVPVDTGTLRASGYAQTAQFLTGGPSAEPLHQDVTDEVKVTATVGYGGPATPYALAVHENPRAGKTGGVSPQGKPYPHWAQTGQWKYLETAAKDHASRLAETVAAAVRKFLGRMKA